MTDYESDKAHFWRNCDVWTLSEVKFLLCGKWPVGEETAPTKLPICILDSPQDIYHCIEEDGQIHLLIEHKTSSKLFNPVPDGTHLEELISRAIVAGALTPLSRSTSTYNINATEDLFKPNEVIAWANARGCFPNFPFGDKGSAGTADLKSNNETHRSDNVDESSEVQVQHRASPNAIADDKINDIGNWKTKVQEEAAIRFKKLRKAGASPTVHSLLDGLASWCRENDIKTTGGIYPTSGYLRTHVLGGRHWTPPR